MNFKKLSLAFLLLLFLLPINNLKAQVSNVGFVPSNIWYSKDPFVEGDKIKIYTLIFNPDARELSGTVIFFDNDTLLGTKKFVLPAKSANDISIDWTVTAGDHTIYAKMENAKFFIAKGKYEEIYVAENQTEKSKRTVAKTIIEKTKSDSTEVVTNSDPIANINNFVKEKTPPAVSNTIDSTVNVLEKTRENIKENVVDKKDEVKKEISALNENKGENNSSKVMKPLKYVELFFLNLFSFITTNKTIFYCLILLVTFLILRFLWRLIF